MFVMTVLLLRSVQNFRRKRQALRAPGFNLLLHNDINLGQNKHRSRIVAWRHQAITWTDVDLSPMKFNGTHQRIIWQEVLVISSRKMSLKVHL